MREGHAKPVGVMFWAYTKHKLCGVGATLCALLSDLLKGLFV